MSKNKKDEPAMSVADAAPASVTATSPETNVSESAPGAVSSVEFESMRLEIQKLREDNKQLAAELDAKKEVGKAAKRAERTGKQLPFALVQVIGNGRRIVAAGEQLSDHECQGLTPGVHFELR